MNRVDVKKLIFLLNLCARSPQHERLLFISELKNAPEDYLLLLQNELHALHLDIEHILEHKEIEKQ